MASGKKVRLARLTHAISQKSLLVPMDHGATVGPIQGITNIHKALSHIDGEGASVQGVVVHRGVATNSYTPGWSVPAPLILHLSASTGLSGDASRKVLVAQVEEALAMGAEAVSIHVNLGAAAEPEMLRDFGLIAERCDRWGMPLLAMMYAPGEAGAGAVGRVKHAARLAAEIGADLVKVSFPGTREAMMEVVEGCFIPVLVAGGERHASDSRVVELAAQALEGGAAGICMGRNIFQCPEPARLLRELSAVVHGPSAVARPVAPSTVSAMA